MGESLRGGCRNGPRELHHCSNESRQTGQRESAADVQLQEVPQGRHRGYEAHHGKAPHPKQVVYGERVLDLVFDFIGVGDLNLGDFFGEKTVNRITTLATPQIIIDRLVALFGESPCFTTEIAKMIRKSCWRT